MLIWAERAEPFPHGFNGGANVGPVRMIAVERIGIVLGRAGSEEGRLKRLEDWRGHWLIDVAVFSFLASEPLNLMRSIKSSNAGASIQNPFHCTTFDQRGK